MSVSHDMGPAGAWGHRNRSPGSAPICLLHTRFSAHAVFCTRSSLYTWLLSPFTCKPFLFTQCLESLPTAVPQLFLPYPTPSCPGLFCHTWQVLQNLPANAGDIRFDPWVRKIPWRRAWQPIPVFLPGESHGQRSLAGYSPWSRRESDLTNTFTELIKPMLLKLFGLSVTIRNPSYITA